MAHWKYTLKLKDLLTEDESPEVVRRVAKAIHARLDAFRAVRYPHDIELDEICNEFLALSKYARPDVEDVNGALSLLYDWGDDGHRLWID